MFQILDWNRSENPEAILQYVVETLRSGFLALIPSGTGYALVGSLQSMQGIDALGHYAEKTGKFVSLVVSSLEEMRIWLPTVEPPFERLLQRLWPGPLIAIFGSREEQTSRWPIRLQQLLVNKGRVAVASPHHSFLEAILLQVDFSLAMIEIDSTLEQIMTVEGTEQFDSMNIAVAVSAVSSSAKQSTWVHLIDSNWQIERHGAITELDLYRASARWIVFVCTGNTCRSPMAEKICRMALSERLGCSESELIQNGYWVQSAGVAAINGNAATIAAVETIQELGGQLSEHRSQLVTQSMIEFANDLIVMSRHHLMVIIERFYPSGAMYLLAGIEGDLEDPIGGNKEIYEACAQKIQKHIQRLITEWKIV